LNEGDESSQAQNGGVGTRSRSKESNDLSGQQVFDEDKHFQKLAALTIKNSLYKCLHILQQQEWFDAYYREVTAVEEVGEIQVLERPRGLPSSANSRTVEL
jgi:hypothetical protein